MIKHILSKKVKFNDLLLLIWFLRRWITTGRIYTENVKNMWSNEWETNSSKLKKKKRVVKHIWTTTLFQRYQENIVELDKSLNEEGKFNYILTVIDNFNK